MISHVISAPVADAARRFRGSAPIGAPNKARESDRRDGGIKRRFAFFAAAGKEGRAEARNSPNC